jgi:phage shock protein A
MMATDKNEQNLERMREAVDRKNEEARAQAEEDSLVGTDRQQEQLSVRAKNSGHGKKTADKWNQ